MIPRAEITAWQHVAPWHTEVQIEQDLLISRAVVEIFSDPFLAEQLAFRGGTALHKLCLPPAARYSEDIDLVQIEPAPIGPILDHVRAALSGWLGEPRRKLARRNTTLRFGVPAEPDPSLTLRLKVEINCREHAFVDPLQRLPFRVDSNWFGGEAGVTTFTLAELLGTKVRALYQRRKGRDLFDLWHALIRTDVVPSRILDIFRTYMEQEGHPVTPTQLYENIVAKLDNEVFRQDTHGLLRPDIEYSIPDAFALVVNRFSLEPKPE